MKQAALSLVLTQPYGGLELPARLVDPSEAAEQLAPDTRQHVGAGEAARRCQIIDEWQRGRAQLPNLAFGAGPHACLGVNLARAELHVGLRALLDRLPGLALDPTDDEPVVAGYAFRGPARLPVVFGHTRDTAPEGG